MIEWDILKLLRGGSWISFDVFARAVYRIDLPPEVRNDGCGFRVMEVK